MSASDIELLSTIYDSVVEVADGVYGVSLKDKYGLVNKRDDIIIEPSYDTGYFRENYTLLGYNAYSPAGPSGGTVNYSLAIMHKTKKRYRIRNLSNQVVKEYSGTGFKILTIFEDLTEDQKQGKKYLTEEDIDAGIDVNTSNTKVTQAVIIDTQTGKELFKFPSVSKISYRPYNNDIIYGIKTPDGKVYGITKDMEFGLVSDLVDKLYTVVKKTRTSYIIEQPSGKTAKLTDYGQLY